MIENMYGYFSFEVKRSDTPNPMLAIFCATAGPTTDEVVTVIREYLKSAIPTTVILLIALESERTLLEQISIAEAVLDCLPVHTKAPASQAVQTVLIPRHGLNEEDQFHGVAWGDIKQSALRTIFDRRNTLLVSPPTHHFAKPSRKHSDKFIRAANALVDGAEITFIAACCLPKVNDEIRHFYCDTGGIAVVAFAIDSLRRRFNPSLVYATVNTFESYGGLKNFKFRFCDEAIVLLSASTSGGLERDIRQRESRIDNSRIITLFSIETHHSDSFIVLDLESNSEHRESIGKFSSHAEETCPWCKQGSVAVPMMGDQFIPSQSVTEAVEIKKSHSPDWLSRFLSATACNGVLRAYYRSPNSHQATSLVFVDMEQVYAASGHAALLRKRIERMLNQAIPVAATRILHLNDPSSVALAGLVEAKLRGLRHDNSMLEVRSIREVRDLASCSAGATIVVAGAIASGQSLLAASQILRDLQTHGAITYLVGLSRMPTAKHLEKHEGDLRMGETAMDYGICVAERIHLPLNGRFVQTSWDEELALLRTLSDEHQGKLRECFEQRIRVLSDALSHKNRGMALQLFWRSPREAELQIRRGFVFLPDSVDAELVSQGDVFFTVVSVLHNMRFGNGARSVLHQTEYRRNVLSPECFDRFNDGVIQASLLRAANRPELNYSSAP